MTEAFKNVAAIILAGGKGTRMGSPIPKVLHRLRGEPLIHYTLAAARNINKKVVVVGYGAEDVTNTILNITPDVEFVLQKEQLGTGHATQQTENTLKDFVGDALILYGDVPLVDEALIQKLICEHRKAENTVTVLTTKMDNPKGLGRIVRDNDNNFTYIVEEKDASPQERNITEINSGIYAVRLPELFTALSKVKESPVTKEVYLTTIIEILAGEGAKVGTLFSSAGAALLGVNTPEQLEQAEAILKACTPEKILA